MKEVGGIMNDKNLAYCSECEDLVEFTEKEEVIEETYKGCFISCSRSDGSFFAVACFHKISFP